jgi:cap1 methyltransferase
VNQNSKSAKRSHLDRSTDRPHRSATSSAVSPAQTRSVTSKTARDDSEVDDGDTSMTWDPSCEVQFVSLHEELEWLVNEHRTPFTDCSLDSVQINRRPFDLAEHTQFVDPAVLHGIIDTKNALERIPNEDVQRARLACNPFEFISKCTFQTRAALKMANLDSICEFAFTGGPRPDYTHKSRSLLSSSERLHFVDVCSGPGGFSEYIFWRRKWEAHGIGFTLRNENDFKLDLFNLPPCPANSFEPFYGTLGDGNVYHPQNLLSLRDFVFSRTDNKGAHLVMADGGFSVAGQELDQEHLLKRIYLCQIICALGLLRDGGHFVCKLFDTFSPVSVTLLYLLYRCFEHFAIVKPNTSRPANSERFVLCKHLRSDVSAVKDFLFAVNCRLDQHSDKFLQQLIPLSVLNQDKRFCSYVRSINTRFGRRQIHFLCKMKAFALDANLFESKKGEIRRRCLEMWQVPNRPEPAVSLELALAKINKRDHALFYYPAKPLLSEQLRQIRFPWNYRFTTLGEDRDGKCQRGFFLIDKSQQLQLFNDGQWKVVPNHTVVLPPFTLIYAELTCELKGEATGQKKNAALHIIDALILGDVQVWQRSLDERLALAEKFVRTFALTGSTASVRSNSALPVRVKKSFNLAQVEQFYASLEMRECKGKRKERLCQQMEGEQYSIVCGVHIYNTLRNPWACRFSQSGGKLYYFNYKKKMDSIYRCPPEAKCDFVDDFSTRLEWTWQDPSELLCSPDESVATSVSSTPSAIAVTVDSDKIPSTNGKVSRTQLSEHIERVLAAR